MKLKKLTAALLLFAALTATYTRQDVFASATQYNDFSSAMETISPCAEQTIWYYRTVDGKRQRRLWSVTECKWLTDWEWA